MNFLVYHSGYERDPEREEGAFDPVTPTGVDRLVASLAAAGVAPGANVYAELGSTWYLMLRRPTEAAHVLGKLLLAVGPERIVWGTDSIWYGSPQPLIDAFRTFTIPTRMQEEFGYPPLTAETKAKILGVNARAVYGITDDDVARARRRPRSQLGGVVAPGDRRRGRRGGSGLIGLRRAGRPSAPGR